MTTLFGSLRDLAAALAGRAGCTVAVLEEQLVEARFGGLSLLFCGLRVFRDPAAFSAAAARAREGGARLLLCGSDEDFEGIEALQEQAPAEAVPMPIGASRLAALLRSQVDGAAGRARVHEAEKYADRYRYELGELAAISRALSSERDVVKLLGLILEKTRFITGADAGSVYIVEGTDPEVRKRHIRFMVSQNDSTKLDLREFTLPVDDKSIVGSAVIGRTPINIPDLMRLGQRETNPGGLSHNRALDVKTGYRTRSMLTVPMLTQRDEVIGVIQLINKKRDPRQRLNEPEDFDREVVPFDKRSQELAETLAAQAGISLENAVLYEDIRRLFEGFVTASVTAIESRDPTTSGHSQRVATLTCGLAEAIDRTDTGSYSGLRFTVDDLKQIEYAGLLHDFGKVGVREKVLVKAKKLYEPDRALLLQRFDYIRKSVEADHLRRKLELILARGRDEALPELSAIDAAARAELSYVDEGMAFILSANEPTVLAEGSFEKLADIGGHLYTDPNGARLPYLTDAEIEALKVQRGSLTFQERTEIERHVVHTYQFLNTIPWGRTMRNIPLIAGAHHEKLDGTGYPKGLTSAEIPVESKMMMIADIFDALTASDRPYKRAVPLEKALDIIGFEVKHGKCDGELFQTFVESKVWTRVALR